MDTRASRDTLHVLPRADLDGPHSIPAQLRALADEIELAGDVRTALVMCDRADGDTDTRCYGFRPQRVYVVGLLEWVKHEYLHNPGPAAPEDAA